MATCGGQVQREDGRAARGRARSSASIAAPGGARGVERENPMRSLLRASRVLAIAIILLATGVMLMSASGQDQPAPCPTPADNTDNGATTGTSNSDTVTTEPGAEVA